MAKGEQVPVTTRALTQRINRKLRDDDRMVKPSRGERARADLGDFYVLDFKKNAVLQKNIDLGALGRELGALQPFERWDVEAK
jgi:hypothetical protein